MTIGHNKQFTLYSHPGGANPWKVNLILEELGLSYHTNWLNDWADTKTPEFLAICPAGTVPLIIDHYNDDFKIWDSASIILYLIEKYDTAHKLSFKVLEEEALARQFLMFQLSSQGVSFREVMWYTFYCPEDVPTVIARHVGDVRKILTMLSNILETSKSGFLVGDKPSYADVSFLPWNWMLDFIQGMEGWKEEFPAIVQWEERLTEKLGSVKKVKEAWKEGLSSLE